MQIGQTPGLRNEAGRFCVWRLSLRPKHSDPGVEDGEGEEAGQARNAEASLEGLKHGLGVRQRQAGGAGGVFHAVTQSEAAEQEALEGRKRKRLRAGSVCHVRV